MSDEWNDLEELPPGSPNLSHEDLATLIEIINEDCLRETLIGSYRWNPDIAVSAFNALEEARSLVEDKHVSAALVLAVSAIELGFKKVYLEPLVRGLIHKVAWELAPVIVSNAFEQRSWQRVNRLLFVLFKEFGNVDMATYQRSGSSKTLWAEAKELNTLRNDVVHRGILSIDRSTADQAIKVAEEILEKLFPALLQRLDSEIHVHGTDYRLCHTPECSVVRVEGG